MHRVTTAFISVGSNIEPFENIPRCLAMLTDTMNSRLIAESGWYLTRPWGVDEQANFINLVIGLGTVLSAQALLRETQAIESRLNRIRTIKNGPRTIDLDILLFGEHQIDSSDLTIPHPALLERDFMLKPLIEIAPDWIHPAHDLPLHQLTGFIRYNQIIERLNSRGALGKADPESP